MKKNTDKEVDEENDKKVVRRTLRLEARVTEQEYVQAAELAKTCGLSMSDYVRHTALGQHPRQRLSDREVEALCSLTDARGDLIRIAAASSCEIHPGRQTSHVFQRYPICRTMDESCYSTYQSLEPDRKLPY